MKSPRSGGPRSPYVDGVRPSTPRHAAIMRRITELFSARWPQSSTAAIYWQLDLATLKLTETPGLPSHFEVEGREYASQTHALIRRVTFTGGCHPKTLHTWLDVRTPTGIKGSETGNKIPLTMQRPRSTRE